MSLPIGSWPRSLTPKARVAGPLDYLEVGYLLIFATVTLMAWAGFTLAEFGLDRPVPLLILAGIGGVVGAWWVLRQRWRPVDLPAALGLCLPIVIGAVLYFPPDEWILGALDPGSYVNAGAAIARGGSIILHDPLLAALDPATRQALFPAPASRLPGFYLMFLHFSGIIPDGFVVSATRVVPHGFHLFPSALAFGYAVGGIRAELLVPPVLAIGGLIGFYLLARRLFGTVVATLAVFFLAIGPAQVWFARYPDAEILAQLLLFGGFLAFVATIDRPNAWLSGLAGLALGSVHLDKIEMLPLPFLIAAFFAYQWLVGRFDRRWLWFVGIYAVLLIQAALHALLIANWYAATTLHNAVSLRLALVAAVALVLALGGALAVLAVPGFHRRVVGFLTHPNWERPLGVGLPLLIGLLAIYAYYVRPLGSVPVPVSQMDSAQLHAMNNLQSFVRLGWYVTPIGLLLGTLGWIFIAHRERNRRAALPLLVIAVDTVLFLHNMEITPIHYWAARRWIPLVIPGFCLAAAYILVYLLPRSRQEISRAVVPFGLGLVMTFGLLGGTRPLLGYVEYRGAIQQLGTLAATFPSNGVVLFADGDAGQRFSVPLQYLFQRTSLVITSDRSMDRAAGQAARQWLAEGRPVYWVSTEKLPGPAEIGLQGQLISRRKISLPEKIATRDRAPGANGLFQQSLEIWRLKG